MERTVLTLPPDVFEAVVTAFAETLIQAYRHRVAGPAPVTPSGQPSSPTPTLSSPWLTVPEAAKRAQCGRKTIYAEVRAGRLRVARIGGGRNLRFHTEWVDAWLQGGTRQN